ncbi:MAG: UbiA family prenyltransferase [Thermoanaerobaculia bacterium]
MGPEDSSSAAGTLSPPAGTAIDYLTLARVDHWVKHVFIVPGIVLACVLLERSPLGSLPTVGLGFAAAALVASANYVLNEWLDAERDRHHPVKSSRPAVAKRLSPALVWTEYLALAAAGLGLAAVVSPLYLVTAALFFASGLLYNVPPVRTKELAYLDVISESVNNPLRLTLGWAMIDSASLPPGSLMLAFWAGGGFLMALKRLAEYRSAEAAGTLGALARYRRSFGIYSANSLLMTAFLYALFAAFALAVFLVKYRIEYLLSMPLFALLFVVYLGVGLKRDSSAQTPERLFREKDLIGVVLLLVVALVILTFVDLPFLDRLTDPHYIRLQ